MVDAVMADLVVEEITKQFPTRSEPLVVLQGVSLELSAGENLAIVGPSGAGKSSLLHIIGTLDQPTSGRVSLRGEDPFRLSEPRLADFRNRNIGFVFQEHHLLPQCNVLENVLTPTIARGSTTPEMVERARALVARVGLENRADHLPAELSGGERQRVAVARALICRPALVLADEPTGNLDRSTAERIGDLLLELPRQDGAMLIAVTHSSQLAARFDRRMELDDGRLALLSDGASA